jgi:DNA-3-methyladenine glycosylase
VTTSGIIVEVEAYIGESDPACHAAPGRTLRNRPLYGPPGFSYVYLNYGIHYLVNVVTEPEDRPAAVLIRALEPLDGVAVMRRRRGQVVTGRRRSIGSSGSDKRDVHDLCRGPGNLTMAMGISLAENQLDLLGQRLFVEDRGGTAGEILWGPRIGIRVGTDRPWRAWLAGHPAVSGPRTSARGTPTGSGASARPPVPAAP